MQIEFKPKEIVINGHGYDRELVERIISMASDPAIEHVVFDGFSGVGGVTEGFSQLDNYMVIACINHWDVAIETHQKNHPDCLHLQEDFKTADIDIVQYMLNEIRKNNPNVKFHLWLSLECTNFSNAKGGMSRDADSRTLADHVPRYVRLAPDVIWVENVKEFMLWGPMIPKVVYKEKDRNKKVEVPQNVSAQEYYNVLINNGLELQCPLYDGGPWLIPDPRKKGADYERWKEDICNMGYDVETKLMNCADYGVPQHRIRLIMQFNREGTPALWPEQTHDKKGRNGLPKWLPVKDCLDLEDEGESVLTFRERKGKLVPRISSEATVDRLINGCTKWVLGKREGEWIVKPNSAKNNTDVSSGASINNASSTLTCWNGLNLAKAHTAESFIVKYLSNNQKSGTNNGASVNNPAPTVTTQNRLGLAKAHMIDHYFGNGYTKDVNSPAGVSGTKDGISLHTVHYMDQQFGKGSPKDIDSPNSSITGVPKSNMVSAHLLLNTNFNNGCKPLTEPSGTQTANRKHYYLVNFQWFNNGFNSVDNPANTLIARMDKTPNYLITLETGELAIEVFDHDPPHYVKLKKFMAEHGIVAINMRMLKDVELLKIMTMPADTKLSSNMTNNKKMIGNAVPSELVRKLGAAWSNNINEHEMVA